MKKIIILLFFIFYVQFIAESQQYRVIEDKVIARVPDSFDKALDLWFDLANILSKDSNYQELELIPNSLYNYAESYLMKEYINFCTIITLPIQHVYSGTLYIMVVFWHIDNIHLDCTFRSKQ